jgi:outer membrane protein OmpA-like peptidoglycan-associated protein
MLHPRTTSLLIALAMAASSSTLAQVRMRTGDDTGYSASKMAYCLSAPDLQRADQRDAAMRRCYGTPPPVGVPLQISVPLRMSFAPASTQLTREGWQILDIAATALRDPGLRYARFRVEGHTETDSSPQANRLLSQARAQLIVDALIARGVEHWRLQAVGYGDSAPLPGLYPRDPRQSRVEIVRDW